MNRCRARMEGDWDAELEKKKIRGRKKGGEASKEGLIESWYKRL